jgi:hypothetical protein
MYPRLHKPRIKADNQYESGMYLCATVLPIDNSTQGPCNRQFYSKTHNLSVNKMGSCTTSTDLQIQKNQLNGIEKQTVAMAYFSCF